MENLEPKNHNEVDQNTLLPLSKRLKSDINRYQKFINHPNVRGFYTTDALNAFFDFLDIVSSKDSEKQELMLEMPCDYELRNEFMIYNAICGTFLDIYGDTIHTLDEDNWFGFYQKILFKSEIDHIKQTQAEIAQLSDPQRIYEQYEKCLIEYEISFDEQCDTIGVHSGYDKRMFGDDTGLSIIDITNTLNELEKNDYDGYIINIQQKYFKPYLLQHPEICSNFIAQKDTEELQNSPDQIEKENQQIYDKIIDHLNKKDQPILLDIDQTQSFALPICTQFDFEERYNDLISYIGAHRQDPGLGYIIYIKHKTGQIHSIPSNFIDENNNEITIGEYLGEKLMIDGGGESMMTKKILMKILMRMKAKIRIMKSKTSSNNQIIMMTISLKPT